MVITDNSNDINKSDEIESSADRLKKIKDFTNEVNNIIDITNKKLEINKEHINTEHILEDLLILEKKTRLAMDIPSSVKLCKYIINTIYKLNDYTTLCDILESLIKKEHNYNVLLKKLLF